MNTFNIIIGIITVIALVITILTLLKDRKKEGARRERTKEILAENIKDSTTYLEKYYDAFEHNYRMYKQAIENCSDQEFNQRIDLITYFINAYSNDPFLENLKRINQNFESYYINNIDDTKFNYDKYFDLKTNLNELIKKLNIISIKLIYL